MNIKKLTLDNYLYPDALRCIPDPPRQLYYLSENIEKILSSPIIAVVGSRKVSNYGRTVTEEITKDLARQGFTIVSGLAFGVDALAHRAALDAGGMTIAVLPCGLDHIYPSSNKHLARAILQNKGALLSEYPTGTAPYKHSFIARNRIISGISKGVIITEAAIKSGSLHTANFALEQGREVFAVPGNITSTMSEGTNNLIKSGASLITKSQDISSEFGIDALPKQKPMGSNENEQLIIDALSKGITDCDLLLQQTRLVVDEFNKSLTMLEITGIIKPSGNNQWRLV